jgi:hypothetical protein
MILLDQTRFKVLSIAAALAFAWSCDGAEPWQEALKKMPLREPATELTRTNCVELLLGAFQPDPLVKAFIFMPGATDEFHFFRRAHAVVTNHSPTLLDAVTALTNQTLIRATWRPPFLLLHTDEDPTEPLYRIEDIRTHEQIQHRKFLRHALFIDSDWDFLHPRLSWHVNARMLPAKISHHSWHFYRHSFAAWNLTAWEALEAVSLAGKTTFTVGKRRVVFEGDVRVGQNFDAAGQ